jgi:uncharacterized protein (TIGR03000 family)
MGYGRPRVGGVALLTVAGLALATAARADWPGRWVDIGVGPYPYPGYKLTEGNIPGARGLTPAYGYYPYYSYNWPSLREALALKRAGLTPADVPGWPDPRPPAPPCPVATPATLRVLVPPDAELWIGDSPTDQRGAERLFVTPPLEGGRNLAYEVRARWAEQGRVVERTRTVPVYPGDRVTVDFRTPEAEMQVLPPPRKLQGP